MEKLLHTSVNTAFHEVGPCSNGKETKTTGDLVPWQSSSAFKPLRALRLLPPAPLLKTCRPMALGLAGLLQWRPVPALSQHRQKIQVAFQEEKHCHVVSSPHPGSAAAARSMTARSSELPLLIPQRTSLELSPLSAPWGHAGQQHSSVPYSQGVQCF